VQSEQDTIIYADHDKQLVEETTELLRKILSDALAKRATEIEMEKIRRENNA
jgi:hypothetical protein